MRAYHAMPSHQFMIHAGKNIAMVKQVDFTMALSIVRYFGGWADKHTGQTIEVMIHLKLQDATVFNHSS